MLDKEFLFKEGYLVFDLESYDVDLYNELKQTFDLTTAKNSINSIRMNGNSNNTDTIEFILKKYNLTDYIIEKNNVRLSNKTSEYQNIIKEIIPHYNKISQMWFYSDDLNPTGLSNISDRINKKIVKELYNQTVTEYIIPELTLYTEGCFIENHNDGEQNFRNCVILIYLNKNWKEEDGGEIILNGNLYIPPTFGKVVVLDFLHNNIEHAVNKVKNDFERYTLIRFINKNLE
jgi:Rps23 Pro-64 3,4-dihydroxylase Tpa1-like proline 4-hydroxylase